MKLLLLFAVVAVTTALPQSWPYRESGGEYYGLQRGNHFRAGNFGSGSGEDDEVEVTGRQDLKVGGNGAVGAAATGVVGQSPATSPVVVLETGSSKPVDVATKATQPKAPASQAASPATSQNSPAFPPATPPSPSPPPTEEDSEEDSEEEAEADDDENSDEAQDDDDEDDEDDGKKRRNRDDIIIDNNVVNATSTTNSTATVIPPVIRKNNNAKKPQQQQNQNKNVQTVEALVPGYLTEQGEVLVPFDTVVKEGDGGVVAVVEDPAYVSHQQSHQSRPPVVVLPSESASAAEEVTRQVPKFFNPNQERQLYYADVPPPGAIFTFDDDNEVEEGFQSRQGETSSEEAQDDDSSAQDEESDEETASASSRPPLSYVKATAPSGEDDEAESLGIRLARSRFEQRYGFYPSRSPNYFYGGNGYYVTRYPVDYSQRPGNYYSPSYDFGGIAERTEPEPIYYYRPASEEKVKVVPIGSFDVNLEEDQNSGEVKAVVSPMYHRRPSTSQKKPAPILRRRPTAQTPSRPLKRRPSGPPPPSSRIIIRRGDGQPSLLAVYNIEGGTPVTRQRQNGGKQRREAKELKKKKKIVKKAVDPLGLMKKVKPVKV